MDGDEGEAGERAGAGQDCPAQQLFQATEGRPSQGKKRKVESRNKNGGGGIPSEVIAGDEQLLFVQGTEEEQAAIVRLLNQRADFAPAGAGSGRASALAWAGLKIAAMVLLAAGVGVGLGDGDEFDDAGCSVAQRPGGNGHGARSSQARERGDGKLPDAGSGSGGGSGDGGPGGQHEGTTDNRTVDHGITDHGTAVVKAVEAAMERFERKLEAVARGNFELRSAKQRLEKMLADGVFAFTRKVDATSFKVLCTILAEGDIAKASRGLGIPEDTLRAVVRRWEGKGKEYRNMADLVRWRKNVGRCEQLPLNEAIQHERAETVDYPGLLSDVLDGLLSMNEENWDERCEELAELLRPAVHQSGER